MLAEGGKHLTAGLLATPACFTADAAVLVMVGVAFAFGPAVGARRGARFQLRGDHGGVRLGLPAKHTAGRLAYISTIEISADAIGQVLHARLAEAAIGACRAGLDALHARFHAFAQRTLIDIQRAGVSLKHFAEGTHIGSPENRDHTCIRPTVE
jgi:hypothetical protein